MYRILIVIALVISINANAQNKVQRYVISPNYVEKVIEHTVEAGQNLYRLSKIYGVKVEKIIERNGLASETIQLDDKIYFYFDDIKASMEDNLVYGAPVYHLVEPKESLFNIARRQYGISMDQVRSWNNLLDNDNLSIGQDLIIGWIPNVVMPVAGDIVSSGTMSTSSETFTISESSSDANTYETAVTQPVSNETVSESATIYSSSNSSFDWKERTEPLKTDVQPAGLNTGNSFPIYTGGGDVATIGEVVNPTPSYSPRTVVSRPEVISVPAAEAAATVNVSNAEATGTTTVITEVENPAPVKPALNLPRSNRAQYIDVRDNPGAKQFIEEKGMAKVLDTSIGSMGSYYCLHSSAPKGTILRVQNPVNNYTIYVEVLGKLPNTGSNENAILKLSKNSVEALNALDHQFLVECEYYN